MYLVVGTGSLGSVGPYYPQGHTEASPITPTPSILYKMDAISGHILWQHHLDYRLNTPILAYNTLYGIASTVFHGSLEALSGNDGSLLWQHQLPQSDADYGDLLYHDDVLYSMALNVNSTLSLFAFSASNGQSIWQDSEGISGSSISSFATTQNMLYFVTDLHHVYAFDVRDGKLLWQRTYSAFIDSNNLFAFNNTLYLITQSLPDPSPFTLYALDSSSGQQRWIHPLSSQNVTFSQIEARQNVFYVVALNATQGPVTMSKYSSTNGNLMSACTLPSNTTMPTVAGKVTLSK